MIPIEALALGITGPNLLILSASGFLLGLALTVGVVLLLPADYFARPGRAYLLQKSPAAVRVAGKVLKNLIGGILVAVGILLSVPGIPGPGLVILLIGLTLVDFPGKYRLQKKLIRRRGIGGTINWIRAKFGRPRFIGTGAPDSPE